MENSRKMSKSERTLYISRRMILTDGVTPAILVVSNEKIEKIIRCIDDNEIQKELQNYEGVDYKDFGHLILMPGIVDSHVHVNEPGRTHWEGFWTATRAAAAGGVTTIVDMPLNSIPVTTNVENLKTKAQVAEKKIFVDVGFWGGVIPGNQRDLKPLVEAGVIGFKCFLVPSGVDEFPCVKEDDVKEALSELEHLNTVLAFHAEIEHQDLPEQINGDVFDYNTYLHTRPSIMETEAIKLVIELCKPFNCRYHIVHLSTSKALSMIKDAKEKGCPISVETCFHYLHLTAERIPKSSTQFKCCPPIRDEANREKLWTALKRGLLDLVVSDHSPSVAELKKTGNFLTDWGGISSLQFGLPLFWTEARNRNFDFDEVAKFLCTAPAKLCGLEKRKGSLQVGMDADFVVWDPDQQIKVLKLNIYYKNKLSPYLDEILYGKVVFTYVRGNCVYHDNQFSDLPIGQLLLRDNFLRDLNIKI